MNDHRYHSNFGQGSGVTYPRTNCRLNQHSRMSRVTPVCACERREMRDFRLAGEGKERCENDRTGGTCSLTTSSRREMNHENTCGCLGNGAKDAQKLKRQIQSVDFALYEVILFLDAYPDNSEALKTYHMLLARRDGLMSEYQSAFGPLTAFGNISHESWDWVKSSSPWEYPHE